MEVVLFWVAVTIGWVLAMVLLADFVAGVLRWFLGKPDDMSPPLWGPAFAQTLTRPGAAGPQRPASWR